jgi:hypothetical protein
MKYKLKKLGRNREFKADIYFPSQDPYLEVEVFGDFSIHPWNDKIPMKYSQYF